MQYTPNAEFRFRDKTSLNFVGQKLVICGRRFIFIFFTKLAQKKKTAEQASSENTHERRNITNYQ